MFPLKFLPRDEMRRTGELQSPPWVSCLLWHSFVAVTLAGTADVLLCLAKIAQYCVPLLLAAGFPTRTYISAHPPLALERAMTNVCPFTRLSTIP